MADVTEFVTCVTGLEPGSGLDPSEAVALGAAVHAGVLAGVQRCQDDGWGVCGERTWECGWILIFKIISV